MEMDTKIYFFHTFEVWTMAFLGNVKLERWNNILRAVDGMTRIVVSREISEGMFKYDHSWRMNGDVIRNFTGCMVKVGFKKWA